MRSISPSQNGRHLGDVGEHLARSPAGLLGVVEGLGQRPRLASLDRRTRRGKAALAASSRSSSVIHARQCGTPGVAWRPAHRSAPACATAAPPAAGETLDDADRHAGRRQPGRRPDRHGRLRQGGRLPAAQGHRPRRVLGRQRPPGGRLLPRPVGLHAGRVQRPRDEGPRPGELRHGPARHPVRVHGAADARRRDRRARPRPRRRRPRHRLRGRRRRVGLARDDDPRRGLGARPDRARRRRGRDAPEGLDPHLRRGPPLVRRPARLPRRLRARLPQGEVAGRARPAACRCSRSTTASATSGSARWTSSSTSTATSWASPSSSTTTTRSSTPSTAR